MKIKKILIVGGGTAGWMTAAALVKQLPNIEVSLVESANYPIIGVGESTLLEFNQFLNCVGLTGRDDEWMPHCNAVYKTSIKFTDWRSKSEHPESFHFPFGSATVADKPAGIMEWYYAKAMQPSIPLSSFAEYYHDSVIMTNNNKFTDNKDRQIDFDIVNGTAYHFDAIMFGEYLRNYICIPSGVVHIIDDVVATPIDSNGNISAIKTATGKNLVADLYIDCTGFKSMLLEGAMGVKFNSFNDLLLNDSAIASQIPYIDIEKEMETVTNCTAIDSGWAWNTPVWNRLGTGYVYSSKFSTPEQAEKDFRKYLASDRMVIQDNARAENAIFRHIKIRHGIHNSVWEKNVLAVGLSAGFIEPLESTGLLITHSAILKLIDTLKMRDSFVNQFDIDCFNTNFIESIMYYKEFVSMHYAMSTRSDTPYWKYATEQLEYSEKLKGIEFSNPDLFYHFARRLQSNEFGPEMTGLLYVATGMGYNPVSSRISELAGMDKLHEIYNQYMPSKQLRLAQLMKDWPSHYEYLKKNIYKSVDNG